MPLLKTAWLIVVCAAIAALAGCGVRGAPELRPEAKEEVSRTATADAGQGKAKGDAGKPHQSSILDALLE